MPPERIDVLKNQEIRFTQVQYLKDPFEFHPFISRLMDRDDATYIYHTQLLDNRIQISANYSVRIKGLTQNSLALSILVDLQHKETSTKGELME